MSLLILKALAVCMVGGALVSSLFINTRSPVLSDRLIVVGIGALLGLLSALAILAGWQLTALVLAMLEGTQ